MFLVGQVEALATGDDLVAALLFVPLAERGVEDDALLGAAEVVPLSACGCSDGTLRMQATEKLDMTLALRNKTPLVVPPAIQRRAGLIADQVEFRAAGGVITITAKLPAADDEYTPAQRRAIDVRLDAARKSSTHGPFTAAQATEFLKREMKVRQKKTKPR
jgi:hypothetical protein